MKTCNVCFKEFPLSNFPTLGRTKAGTMKYRPMCKPCRKIEMSEARKQRHPDKVAQNYQRVQAWKAANPDSVRASNRRYKWKSQGIDPNLAETYFIAHHGLCDSCGELNRDGRALCVDHNHTTGAIRGMLCDNCNLAIGYLKDNPNRIQDVYNYLITKMH